jgi:predicted RNA binding protein YcfA (HicA-like mRNA interferase family)
MTKKDKLLARLFSKPKDFEWRELKTLLKGLGFEEVGSTGSRVKFQDSTSGRIINLHRPHPGNVVKQYVLDRVIEELKDRGIRP